MIAHSTTGDRQPCPVPRVDRASALVQKTLDQCDATETAVATLARRCQGIASPRGDAIPLSRLTLESTDVANMSENKSDAPRESLTAHLPKHIPGDEANTKRQVECAGYISRHRMGSGNQEANFGGVQQIEDLAKTLPGQEATTLIPPPPGMHTCLTTSVIGVVS